MNKKTYKKPATRTVALHHQQHLLTATETSPRPSASFMSNTGIGDTDDDE